MRTTTACLTLIAAAMLPRAAWAGLFVGNPPSVQLDIADMKLSASKIEGVRCDGTGLDTLATDVTVEAGSGDELAAGLASHCSFRLTDALLFTTGDDANGPGTFSLELSKPVLILDVPTNALGSDDLWIELDASWEGTVITEMGSGDLEIIPPSSNHDTVRDAWVGGLSLSL